MDLQHPKVRQLDQANARCLGMHPSLVTFVFADSKPRVFDYWCAPAVNGWTCYVPDKVEAAYPVWSCNADQTLLMTSGVGNWFGVGHHDDPEIVYAARTHQGLYAHLFLELGASDASDKELDEGARFCGFSFLNETIEFLDSRFGVSDWEQSRREFIADIDKKAA